MIDNDKVEGKENEATGSIAECVSESPRKEKAVEPSSISGSFWRSCVAKIIHLWCCQEGHEAMFEAGQRHTVLHHKKPQTEKSVANVQTADHLPRF